ncbi:MAG: hypothetical protein ABFE13_22715 [Phycisphaerales bacterium]
MGSQRNWRVSRSEQPKVRSVGAVFNQRGSKFDAVAGVLRSPYAPSGLRARGHSRHDLRAWGLVLVLTLVAMEAMGCNNGIRPVTWTELGPRNDGKPRSLFRVVAQRNLSVAILKPADVVRIMRRVGFADEQVLELGTDLHNALRFSGAAEVFYRKDKLAIFVSDGDFVRIRSRSGAFDYQVSTGQFVSPVQKDRQ